MTGHLFAQLPLEAVLAICQANTLRLRAAGLVIDRELIS